MVSIPTGQFKSLFGFGNYFIRYFICSGAYFIQQNSSINSDNLLFLISCIDDSGFFMDQFHLHFIFFAAAK
jgi:hypothetical protein